MAAFYADDAVVASRDPDKLQDSFDELTALFDCVGLKTNAKKTEVMVMTPGRIRTKLSPEGYEARMRLDGEDVGLGGRGPVGRVVQCPKCRKTLKAASLRSHMETQHGEYEVFVPPAEDASPPVTYHVMQDAARGGLVCPVQGCPYDRARDHYRLRAFRHPRDTVVVDGTTGQEDRDWYLTPSCVSGVPEDGDTANSAPACRGGRACTGTAVLRVRG